MRLEDLSEVLESGSGAMLVLGNKRARWALMRGKVGESVSPMLYYGIQVLNAFREAQLYQPNLAATLTLKIAEIVFPKSKTAESTDGFPPLVCSIITHPETETRTIFAIKARVGNAVIRLDGSFEARD